MIGTVNLLPEWYLRQQRLRRQLHVRIFLMVILAGALGGWICAERTHIRSLHGQRDELAKQCTMIRDLSPDLEQAQHELERLQGLQLAFRDLGNTAPMSALTQQIQNNLTEGMALSRLTIDVRPEPVKAKDGTIDAANPKFHDVARLTVVGIAPNDVLIAQLIGKLSANPLFTDLSLNYTRTELLHDYDVRRFEIQMVIDLDRLGSPAPTPAATPPTPTSPQASRGEVPNAT